MTNADFTGTATQPPPAVFNRTINYAYNSVGALSGIGTDLIGSDPNATTNVLNSLTFRAGGALRALLSDVTPSYRATGAALLGETIPFEAGDLHGH